MFFFWFSLTNSEFSVNVSSFLGFPSVEITSDDGYQIGRGISSDNHRPILYHVISFIQWDLAEIIRWVIKLDRNTENMFYFLIAKVSAMPCWWALTRPKQLSMTPFVDTINKTLRFDIVERMLSLHNVSVVLPFAHDGVFMRNSRINQKSAFPD